MRRALIFLALSVGAGCVTGEDADPTTPDSNDSGSGGTTNTPPSHDYAYRFQGRLASTGDVPFGGSPYCDYSVKLSDIVVDVVLREPGQLVNTIVTDVMTEQSLNGCPYGASPPSQNVYEYSGTPIAGESAFTAALDEHAANYPDAENEVAVVAMPDALPKATVHWHRIDQPPPLDWDIRTPSFELAPVTCTQGSLVCVGRAEGTLFSCDDGMRLVETKRCAAGCASADSCR